MVLSRALSDRFIFFKTCCGKVEKVLKWQEWLEGLWIGVVLAEMEARVFCLSKTFREKFTETLDVRFQGEGGEGSWLEQLGGAIY